MSSSSSSISTLPNKKPKYIGPIVFIIGLYYVYWSFGVLKYILAWTFLHYLVSPFIGFKESVEFVVRSFKNYQGFPVTFNLSVIFYTFSRFFIYWPLGTFLWIIDDILYSDWKNVKIEKPIFIIGQPRSGTTKLEALLDNDKQFYCLRTYDITFPFIFVQKFVRWLGELDQKYTNGAISKGLNEKIEFNSNETLSGKMRPIKLTKPEEDDFLWQMWFNIGILIASFYPDAEGQELMHCFSKDNLEQRKRMMKLHSDIVKKTLYFNAKGCRYMAKWVMGWNGEVQATREMYPDARYITIVRNPHHSVPSWVKLIGLLAEDFTSFNFINARGEGRDKFIQLTAQGYHETIKFCNSIPKERIHLLEFDKFYSDIRGQTKELYDKFGWTFDKQFEEYLIEEQKKQKSFVGTKLDYSQISKEEIETLFPDLQSALFSEQQ